MLVAVVRDISERKQAEAERRRLEEELAQMRRMESIGRLAGGMAHDFNNMLTPILSYATMLRDDLPADDERRTDLGEVVRAAERARDLVRQLLAYSRRQAFALRPLDLSELVRGFELLPATLVADIAIVLLVAAMELDQALVVERQRTGDRIGQAVEQAATQAVALGFDVFDGVGAHRCSTVGAT